MIILPKPIIFSTVIIICCNLLSMSLLQKRQLARIGGADTRLKVTGILGRLMDNSVASQFNFQGKNCKMAFSRLGLYKVTLGKLCNICFTFLELMHYFMKIMTISIQGLWYSLNWLKIICIYGMTSPCMEQHQNCL